MISNWHVSPISITSVASDYSVFAKIHAKSQLKRNQK